jgi:hypothetical protein
MNFFKKEPVNPALRWGPGSINRRFCFFHVSNPIFMLGIDHTKDTSMRRSVVPARIALYERELPRIFRYLRLTDTVHSLSLLFKRPRSLGRRRAIALGNAIARIEKTILSLDLPQAGAQQDVHLRIQLWAYDRSISVCAAHSQEATQIGPYFLENLALPADLWTEEMSLWFNNVTKATWVLVLPASSAHDRLARQTWLAGSAAEARR